MRPLLGFCVWLTGYSAAGKTTIGKALTDKLRKYSIMLPVHLDGDLTRQSICRDLGFSPEDRSENISRCMAVAAWEVLRGSPVVASYITPYQADREKLKVMIPNCIVVWANTPLDVCEARDPKGLYKKARAGEIPDFTGVHETAPYEEPYTDADLIVYPHQSSVSECVNYIEDELRLRRWIK